MELVVFTEPQQGASYETLLAVARAAEDLGFHGFFRSDHFLAFGTEGLPGPTDAWVTLAGLARETSWVRLGTLVSSATFRLPGPLAIAVAQVDAMSGGRVELGLGAGWFADEHTAYGIPFPTVAERFDRLTEQLAIIDGLWRTPVGERFSYEGKHFTVTDSPALPKPLQRPRPPIIVGGKGRRRTPELAATYADEYNVAFSPLAEVAECFQRVREACARRGREERSLRLSTAQVLACGRDEAEVRRRAEAIGQDVAALRERELGGWPGEVVDRLGELAELGVVRVYLQVLDLADLDHLELVASRVLPQVR